MHDFSKKYRNVAHFGLWAEEGAVQLGDRDAWAILVAAARRCRDHDVRSEGLNDALAWFECKMTRTRSVYDFKAALDCPNAQERFQGVYAALTHIGRVAGIVEGGAD